jgi:hypothetical protein
VPLWDIDDVYQVHLVPNERFDCTLTPPANADFDLYFIAPGTKRLADAFTYPWKPILKASENGTGVVDAFTYVSDRSTPATFYLDVAQQHDGSGAYTLVWRRSLLPTPEVTSTAPAVVAYGGRVAIRGFVSLGAVPVQSLRIEVQAKPFGATAWSRVATGTTGDDGAFSAAVKPVRRTQYRVRSLWSPLKDGTSIGYGLGPAMTVSPKARLTIKAPLTAVRGRTFTVSGVLAPKHAKGSGHVRVIASRWNGSRYVPLRTTFSARHTATGWSAAIKLPYRGTWRLQARVPADGLHAETLSAIRKVRVR